MSDPRVPGEATVAPEGATAPGATRGAPNGITTQGAAARVVTIRESFQTDLIWYTKRTTILKS